METVEVTASLLEVLDPFLWLFESNVSGFSFGAHTCTNTLFRIWGVRHPYLCDHHMAVKGALAVSCRWTVDM